MTKPDFDGCLVDPTSKDLTKDPLIISMGLPQVIEAGYDKHEVLKYTIAMYDKKSPFQSMRNLFERKSSCAEFAGFKTSNKGEFMSQYQDLMNCVDDWYKDLIIRYCQERDGIDWIQLVALTNQMHQTQSILMGRMDIDKDKDLVAAQKNMIDVAKNSGAIKQLIDDLVDKMISKDKNENLRERVFRKASLESNTRPALTPEYMSGKTQKA